MACWWPCCRKAPLIYISGTRVDDITIRKLDRGGSPPSDVWTFDHGALSGRIDFNANQIAVLDPSALGSSGHPALRYLNPDGTEEWNTGNIPDVTHLDCAVGPSGEVFTSRRTSAPIGQIRKYNANGTIAWTRNLPSAAEGVNGVAADTNGDCYVCFGDVGGGGGVARYNSAGTLVWNTETTLGESRVTNQVAVAGETVYFVRQSSSSAIARFLKLNRSDGSLVWGVSTTHNAFVGIEVDPDENVILYEIGDSVTTHRLSKYAAADGARLWTTVIGTGNGDNRGDLKVDSAGRCYTAGPRFNNLTHRRFSRDGDLQWAGDHGGHLRGIALQP